MLNSKASCPGHKGIRTRMEAMRVCLQQQFEAMLKDEWVTVSSDSWTSRCNDTYLGVTYHCIDAGWRLRSLTVDCEKLVGSTTGEELVHKVPNAWKRRNVAGFVANVTDCEPSMVKMGRLVHDQDGIPWYGCVDHRLEKTAQKYYSHPHVASTLKRAQDIASTMHQSSQVYVSRHAHMRCTRALPVCEADANSSLSQADALRVAGPRSGQGCLHPGELGIQDGHQRRQDPVVVHVPIV